MIKKIAASTSVALLALGLLSGCSNNNTVVEPTTEIGQQNIDNLIGSWSWDTDATWIYHFNEDNTGTRPNNSFDSWLGFTWNIYGDNNLVIILDYTPSVGSTENWLLEFSDENTIVLTPERHPETSYSYNRIIED